MTILRRIINGVSIGYIRFFVLNCYNYFGFWNYSRQETRYCNDITAERKNWREKIRTIADNIEKSKFQGEGTQNISYYLNQLKMNINTYGKFDKADYVHDGHIWEIIEIIQCTDNEKEFEKDKNLLLSYISLMSKEDGVSNRRLSRAYFSSAMAGLK